MSALPRKKSGKFSVPADELKDVLECPVCLKVPRQSPVYQCDRGHCLCSSCHAKLTNCPVCRIPLGKTRSLIFEKVLAKMPHSCKFTDMGCNIEQTRTKLESHEKDCPYRVVGCVDLACQQQVCMQDLVNHMTNDHEREDFVHTENHSYKSHFIVQSSDFTREIMWISDHIELEGRHFFRECCRNKDGQWFVWVYMIGSRKECDNYIYTVRVFTEDKEEELSYKGRCVPLDVSKEKLVDNGNCLTFPDSTAKRFWANQRILYQVYVCSKNSKKVEKEGARHRGYFLARKDEKSNEAEPPACNPASAENSSSEGSNNASAPEQPPKAQKSDSNRQPLAGSSSNADSSPAEEERETPC